MDAWGGLCSRPRKTQIQRVARPRNQSRSGGCGPQTPYTVTLSALRRLAPCRWLASLRSLAAFYPQRCRIDRPATLSLERPLHIRRDMSCASVEKDRSSKCRHCSEEQRIPD